jgi:hypothetical protein
MEVYAQDGERLGCIEVIWPYVPISPAGEPLAPWDLPQPEADAGYFQVGGDGVLGIGAKHWYVPMRDIAEIGPGERLTLVSTLAECDEQYTQRPGFVEVDIT